MNDCIDARRLNETDGWRQLNSTASECGIPAKDTEEKLNTNHTQMAPLRVAVEPVIF
jgi:hypothetical protein